MTRISLFNLMGEVFRAASGDLSVGETVAFSSTEHSIEKFRSALVDINVANIETPDPDDEIDFFVQTSYDKGTTWEDVANFHLDNGDDGVEPQFAVISIGPAPAGVGVFAHSDQALADNTNRDLPLGDRLRIVVVLTGATAPTYDYSARVSLYG